MQDPKYFRLRLADAHQHIIKRLYISEDVE